VIELISYNDDFVEVDRQKFETKQQAMDWIWEWLDAGYSVSSRVVEEFMR
jgi:hypothetical protein